ncbi:MAG TPA: GNAT family protein, partial [Bacillota bacterium]|nr:GNAT family protein [Bacillota bacterium]
LNCYKSDSYYQWAIVPDGTNEPIGDIAVVDRNDEIQAVHIGYALGKKYWHQGYMSEALAGVMDFLFTDVGINRIESQHDPNNPNSGGVMKKCGMKYEGTHRQADFSNQGTVDACVYALLRDEWDIQRDQSLQNSSLDAK